jgi:hypothetical protein
MTQLTGNALKKVSYQLFAHNFKQKASELSGVSIGLSADGMGVS